MKKIYFFGPLLFLFSLLFPNDFSAQQWQQMMADPNANFYDIQEEFNNYWANRPYERGKGYKQFRRWENYMEPRVYPSGDIKQASRAYTEFMDYKVHNPTLFANQRAANWVPLGPTGAPAGGGAGRINFVRFDPTNSNKIFAGAPDGGLWISTNGGVSYTSNTDQLAVIGCTDIAIDPTNTQIMYLATGDGDGADTYSVGVLKSTDGGATWNTTGLNWAVTQGRTISRLAINPSNPQIVIAATSNGIYRTTNGGTSWTQVQNSASFKDMELKPGDPNTVYACGTTFWKSTNAGQTWTQVTSGLPTTGVARMAIGVTPNDANYVYVLVARSSDNGFQGIYRSIDQATTFTTRATSPNLLGWNSNGGDAGGQGWYDLAIAVSPTNRDVVIVGGVNIWRSTNGGTNWTINGHWTGSGAPYVHADIHDLIFLPGSGTTYYSGNDGGVFRTTNSGGAWSDISSNLQIAQQYRVGLSSSNANLLIAGHQDNGTNRLNGTTWTEIYGGDGMDCFIDRTNNNTMYASYVNGAFKRSTNGGAGWTNIVTGLTGNAAWVAPWHQDPVVANTLYAGYSQVFRSTNQGTNWTSISSFAGNGTIVELAIAPSNNQVIYAARSNNIYKTTNGGGSWTTITGTLPVGSAQITYIAISSTDPNRVYVTFSGYSAANKVFVSTNGGTSWTNISSGLPNLPVNCIVYQTGSADGIYIGTDVGVYYRDNTSGGWLPYMAGLPNVGVRDLEIYYPTGKIRAATFGRSTWESDLNTPGSQPPIADFTANNTTVCPGSTVQFTDLSSWSPTSWSWSFAGGTPATSTAQNPSVVYNTVGTYQVSLTATNANGSDTKTVVGYITVTSTATLPLVQNFEGATFPPTGWIVQNSDAPSAAWGAAGPKGLERRAAGGNTGSNLGCAAIDCYYYNTDTTVVDNLISVPVSLVGASAPRMTFKRAYQYYNSATNPNNYHDELRIYVSADCGTTYGSAVYYKKGVQLATSGTNNNAFTPSVAADWDIDTVDLSAYVGQNIVVKFEVTNRYGQDLYLDDINIDNTTTTVAGVSIAQTSGTNPTCSGQSVTFTATPTNGGTSPSYQWQVNGVNVGTNSPTFTTPSLTNGQSVTCIMTSNLSGVTGNPATSNAIVMTVNTTPSTPTASSNSPVCTGQTINLTTPTVSGATYAWTGPATFTSSAQNPTRPSATTAMGGTYSVTVTVNGCTSTAGTTSVTVNTTPATPTASSNSPVCTGQTINLSTPTVAGATYSWTGPATFTSSSQNPTRPSATTAMAGTYSVTVTQNGCTSTAGTTAVTVNTTPATPTASSNSPVCTGQTINLTTPTVAGATYSWTGPATFTSSTQNPTRPSATTAMGGTYSVTVTQNGCTSTAGTTAVTVNATPATPTASSNSPVCTGQTINLTTPTVAGATYAWTGPAAFSSSAQNPSRPSATLAMAGTYSVTVTVGGCTSAAGTTNVSVGPAATPTVTIAQTTGSNPSCAGATLAFTATPTNGGTPSYQWKVNGINVGTNSAVYSASNFVNGDVVTCVMTSSSTCVTSSTATSNAINLVVNPIPATPTISSNSPLCTGQTLTLSTPTVSGATYSWTNQGTWTSSLQNPTRPNATIGMGQVYNVTVTVNGCTSAMGAATIVVNQTPSAPTASSNSPVCTGQTINLTTPTVSGATYAWTGPATFTSSAQNPTRPSATTAMGGTYSVTVTQNGCTSTAGTTSVTVNTTPAAPTASSNSPVCEGQSITLSTATVSGATYDWTGPNGFTDSSQNPTITGVTSTMSGSYSVTVTTNGCTSTAGSTSVTVNPIPATPTASSNSPVCTGSTINLTTPTVVGATYSWTGPNGFTSSSQNPTIASASAADDGTYNVTVTVGGCISAAGTTIVSVGAAVTPTISIAFTDGGNPACVGQSLTFEATATNEGTTPSYQWQVNGSNVGTNSSTFTTSGLSNGDVVTCIITSSAGCVTSSTATSNSISMTVNNLPSTPTISQNGNVLTSSASTGNQWYLNGVLIPGATGQTYTATQDGNYTVTTTDANGCTSNASTTTVLVGTGISITTIDAISLNIYPNPSQNYFTFEVVSPIEGQASIEITNSIGQIVYTTTLTLYVGQANKTTIDLSAYANGIYTASLKKDEEVLIRKMIKF